MQRRTSDIERRTSDIERKTLDIERKTSDIERRTSDIERRTSDIERRTLDIERKTLDMQRNASKKRYRRVPTQRCPNDEDKKKSSLGSSTHLDAFFRWGLMRSVSAVYGLFTEGGLMFLIFYFLWGFVRLIQGLCVFL